MNRGADFERREPRCRVCRDPDVRILVNELLDWRGVPIILGRGKTHRITYDSLWIHAKRHYDLARIVAYRRTRLSKEFKEFKKALRG
jgi:hypothetical protein